jgi:hypothetical protein
VNRSGRNDRVGIGEGEQATHPFAKARKDGPPGCDAVNRFGRNDRILDGRKRRQRKKSGCCGVSVLHPTLRDETVKDGAPEL